MTSHTRSLVLCSLFAVSGSKVFATDVFNIDSLNQHLDECFEQTTQGMNAKKRSCNVLIKSPIVSRENRAVAFHNRGVINLNKGDVKQAVKDFKRALKLAPGLADTRQVIAQQRQGQK